MFPIELHGLLMLWHFLVHFATREPSFQNTRRSQLVHPNHLRVLIDDHQVRRLSNLEGANRVGHQYLLSRVDRDASQRSCQLHALVFP